MTIDHDVALAGQVGPKEDEAAWKELAPRLAASTHDAALDALIQLFFHERYCYHRPAKAALIDAVHPETSARLAARMVEWAPDEDQNLATSHGAEVIARRGDASVAPRLREALALVDEEDMSIVGRSLLIARLALGDGGADELRAIYREHEDGSALEDTIAWGGASAYYEAFAPIVEAYQQQDGANEFRLAPAILFDIVADDAPDADPRWFELALTLRQARARPKIAHLVERVLARVAHPNREALLRTAAAESRSRFLRRLAGEHELLDGVDPAFVDKHDLKHALREADDGWVLHTWTHRAEDIEAILDRLGTHIVGLSFRGRQLPVAAIAKLAEHTMLARVRRLDLSGNSLGTEGVATLLKSPYIGELTHLALDHCALGTPALTILGHTTSLPALRELSVAADRLGSEDLGGLLGPATTQLQALDLGGWEVDFERLVSSATYPSLKRLHATTTWKIEPLLEDLQLETLSFAGARNSYSIDWREVSPGALRSLVLDDCMLSEERTEGLFVAPLMSSLRELSLAGCWVPGVAQLLEVEAPELRRLSLRHVHAVDRDLLAKLAAWPVASRLEELDVGGDTDLRASDLDDLPEPVREAILRTSWPD